MNQRQTSPKGSPSVNTRTNRGGTAPPQESSNSRVDNSNNANKRPPNATTNAGSVTSNGNASVMPRSNGNTAATPRSNGSNTAATPHNNGNTAATPHNNGNARLLMNNAKNNSKKLVSPTFAAKFAAFVLNNVVIKNIEPYPSEIVGILPFLQLNISEAEYLDMTTKSTEQMTSFLTDICNTRGVSNCKDFTLGAKVLAKRFVETVVSLYSERTLGQNNAKLLADNMRTKGIAPQCLMWCNGI